MIAEIIYVSMVHHVLMGYLSIHVHVLLISLGNIAAQVSGIIIPSPTKLRRDIVALPSILPSSLPSVHPSFHNILVNTLESTSFNEF